MCRRGGAVHAIEPERLLSDRTWTQWKAAAGIVPAPADQDLAVLAPAVARACQLTAPGYLSAIKALPASGLSLVGEDSAAANMLYSMLWEKKGEQRGLGMREEAFRPRGLHQLRGGVPHRHGLGVRASNAGGAPGSQPRGWLKLSPMVRELSRCRIGTLKRRATRNWLQIGTSSR